MGHSKSASKHEYDKPQLKQQIEAAMADFLKQGHAVQRVPSVVVQDPPVMLGPPEDPKQAQNRPSKQR